MVRRVAVVVVPALVLYFLTEQCASKSCTFKDGGCTYNIHLTHSDAKENGLQNNNCGTKEQQIFIERAQNDYAAKIEDMEKNFSFLRDAHDQRIKELESTVKEMRHPNTTNTFPPGESVAPGLSKIPQQLIFSKDPIMKRLEEGFNKMRDELKLKTEDLAEANTRLNETAALVHEVHLLHFKASQDLLNAENEISLLKRERAVLKNQLKDRQYRLDISTEKANECEFKSAELQDQMTELFRSENTLREELMTAQLRLNKSMEVHGLLDLKHANLKTKHEKMRVVMKLRERELMDCYLAKTSVFCGFEDPKMCGFTNVNDSSDFFDWERGKGHTPSSGTGPSRDHTCNGPNGHFMFIEASAKVRGNNAILFSPLYRGLSEQCVEFFYHMNGKQIGTLNVYAQAHGDILKSAWRAYGNQGDVWTNARLAIPQTLAMAGYQIAFEGITENGYLGDISIDDVSIRDGPCPVDGKLVPVNVEVNSTKLIKNIDALTRKQRRWLKRNDP